MPELPEITIVTKELRILKQTKLIKLECQNFNRYRSTKLKPKSLFVTDVQSFGKDIYIKLCDSSVIELNLGLTGRIILFNKYYKASSIRAFMVFENSKGDQLNVGLIDERGFGNLTIVQEINESDICTISKQDFIHRVTNSKSHIYNIIMNQSIARGVGSYLAHEALFRSKISPIRRGLTNSEAGLLFNSILLEIKKSIRCNGNTWDKFVYPEGGTGKYYVNLKTYGRKSKDCLHCATKLSYIKISGRGVTYCDVCQK